MDHHDELDQQLWEFVYGLLSEQDGESMRGRIRSEPWWRGRTCGSSSSRSWWPKRHELKHPRSHCQNQRPTRPPETPRPAGRSVPVPAPG